MLLRNLTKYLISTLFVLLAATQSTTPPSIVTGPIIGKVTTTTARVLIEFNAAALVTVILTDPTGQQFTAQKNTTASIPVPFAFDGLQPNTKYVVSLSDPSISIIDSYFTTLSGESGKLNFAVMSCMDKGVQASKDEKADLWADLLTRIQNNEVNYLLQTGDQVYMDDPFGKNDPTKPYFECENLLNSTSRDQWDSLRPQLLEFLRNEYRATWNIPSVKEVLAKIPQLTILDDHQVRDDWGYLAEDSDPNSVDYYYGSLARQVYYEYERQLREDIDFSNLTAYTTDYYYETLNDIGFVFIEYRGVRTWNRNFSQMGSSQLGAVQTQFVQQALDPNTGPFANASNLYLISPLTVVFLAEALVKIGYYDNNDAEESWTYKYKYEQVDFLGILRTWMLAKPGRQLTILDGDVHMGGFTDITYNDDFTFLQFTSSSIASSAPGDLTFLAFDALKEIQDLVNPWSYEHHDWTNKFNYGIVLADLNDDGTASSDCYMIKASSSKSPEMVDVDGHKVDDDDWNEIIGRS